MKNLKYVILGIIAALGAILPMHSMNHNDPSFCEIAPEYFTIHDEELVLADQEQLELDAALALSLMNNDQIPAENYNAQYPSEDAELELALKLSIEQAEEDQRRVAPFISSKRGTSAQTSQEAVRRAPAGHIPIEEDLIDSRASAPRSVPIREQRRNEAPVYESSDLSIPAGLPQKVAEAVQDLKKDLAAVTTGLKPLIIRGLTAEFRSALSRNIAKACCLKVYDANEVLDDSFDEDTAYNMLKKMFRKSEDGVRSLIILEPALFNNNPEDTTSVHYKKLALQSFLGDYSKRLSDGYVVVLLFDGNQSCPWMTDYENGFANLLNFNKPTQPNGNSVNKPSVIRPDRSSASSSSSTALNR